MEAAMTSSELWSDGNALAGPLQDLFRVEVTTAIGRCTNCGRTAPMAPPPAPTPRGRQKAEQARAVQAAWEAGWNAGRSAGWQEGWDLRSAVDVVAWYVNSPVDL
jgi:hypothetical protein